MDHGTYSFARVMYVAVVGDELELSGSELRANPWLTGLTASPFGIIAILGVLAIVFGNPLFMIATPHLLLLGIFASIWNRVRRPFARVVPVQTKADSNGVTIDDGKTQEHLQASDITSGVKVPALDGAVVRLKPKRGPRRELRFPQVEDADALLRTIGQDVGAATASFRGMSRTYSGLLRLYVTLFGMMGLTAVLAVLSIAIHPIAAAVIGPLGLLTTIAMLLWPSRVEVGADGLLIKWFGRQRFVSHDRIQHVRVRHMGMGQNKWETVELTLTDGEALRLPMPRLDQDASRILAQRILDARNAAASGAVAPTAMLLRSKRSFREWVQALRKREVTDLRSPAVPKEHLWPVIEDAGTDALERAAAVVALGPDLGDAERQRLARVAKVVAAPKLRVVIEQGPDAEEEDLARMLEEVEVAAPKTRLVSN